MNDQLEANKRIVNEWHELAIHQSKPEQNGNQILSLQSEYPAMGLGLVQFIEHQVKGSDLIRSSHEQA